MQISMLMFHKLKLHRSTVLYSNIFTSTHFEFSPLSQDKEQPHSIHIKSSFHLRGHDLESSFLKGKTHSLPAGWVFCVISPDIGK